MSRSSICRFFSIAIVAAAVIAHVQTAGAFEISSKSLLTESWSGFGDDFEPSWFGETKRVDWRPPSSTGPSGVILWNVVGSGWVFPLPPPPKPIRLASSNRLLSYTATATLFDVTAESGATVSEDEEGSFALNAARYGEIVNLSDLLLVDARTVAEQESTLTDNSIMAKGRVATLTSLHPELVGHGDSSAFGYSLLSAKYVVNELIPFKLNGYLAGAGSLDVKLSISDSVSGQSLYQVNPTVTAVGQSWNFDLSGTLSPGSYTIAVSATSTASSLTPEASFGGFGEYQLLFSAETPADGDLNLDSLVNGADLALWKSSFGKDSSGDLNKSGVTDGADFLIWQRSVNGGAAPVAMIPEPASLWLTCFSAWLLVGKGRCAQKKGMAI